MENAPSATNVFPIFPYLLLVEFNGGRECRLFDFSRRLEEPVYAPLGEWPVFRQAACHPEGATNKWPDGSGLEAGVIYADSLPLAFPARLPGYIPKPPA